MQYFYTSNIKGNHAILEAEEAAHCAQVLRKRPGDPINLVDGRGNWYQGILTESHRKKCIVEIRDSRAEVLPHTAKIHIAIAPTKNINRLEWFLEKATEIGIHRITPILCQRSERKKIRNDRLEKILLAAMKQSLKATLPILDELQPFDNWITDLSVEENTQKFIAYCNEENRLPLQTTYKAGNDVLLLIGPEGDFHPNEVKAAKAAGFTGVSLGPSRLRTETAGIVGCHTLNLKNFS
ncbi:MAG: 16S rRNA (uracil(1498)-N(3))-methyltransferase [Saprospiraceae bacterium]